jgi:hypothetical protein
MTTFIKIILLISISFSSFTFSADSKGKFAVKGAGSHTCSDFIQAAETKSTDYYLYGGWLEGFISSYNQFQPNNFDITPWQTTELMLVLLKRHCKNNTNLRFLSATNSLIKTLFPIRLNTENNLVTIQVSGRKSYYYQDIIMRAKKRLKALGYLKAELKPTFDQSDAIAFAAYQKAIGINPSGIPDQQTLVSLFLKSVKE